MVNSLVDTFFVDGSLNWYFWGNWLILIGTILTALVVSFIFGSDGDLIDAVGVGLMLACFAFIGLLVLVLFIIGIPKIFFSIVGGLLVLYFAAYLGKKSA